MPRRRLRTDVPVSRWFLRPSDQKVAAALLLAAQVALAMHWLSRRDGPGHWINLDAPPRRSVSFLVDVNTADESELSLLPRIGPKLAARIVAWRTEHGPFRSLTELGEVHGLGPKTLAGIAPYVRALPLDEPNPVP